MSLAEGLPCLLGQADGSVVLRLHVQPRAAADGVAGLQGGLLKLRLTSPPVDGKANKAVIVFLAKLFHLPKSAITITSGLTSRSKSVRITGAAESRLRIALQEALGLGAE